MKVSPAYQSRQQHSESVTSAHDGRRGQMRAVANNVILHIHPTKVPAKALRFTYTWGLGGISALLAVILGVTGVLLSFRYEPNIERAYASIQLLETQVAFGSLFRAIHHWSANLLVITAFLHLLRVVFTGGFKQGRTANWLIGVFLLLIVLAFNFTGYLLPWDQMAYWAITVSTSLLQYIPLLGSALSNYVLAGQEIGQGALSNFYGMHVSVLPMLLVGMMAYHFWKIRKNGGISKPVSLENERVKTVTTIPHLVSREFAAAGVILAAIILWSMWQPAPLSKLANPTLSPNPAKAAWYFLGLQELLLHMDTLAAIILVTLFLLAMIFLPKFDRQEAGIGIYFQSALGRRAAVVGTLLSLLSVPILVIVDEFWIDWPALLPNLPVVISNGLIPLLLTLAGVAAIYGLLRLLRANHGEAFIGLFSFVIVSLIVLTVIGIYFRGPNMALVLPFGHV